MNLNITGTTLDIILLVILILSIFIGWKNGLVDSVLRFILTIVVIGLSWFISNPLAMFITLPEMQIEAELLTFVAPFLQRAAAFIVVLIVLSIAKNIIYMLLKPIILKIIEFFKIVDFVDSVCGAVFNVAKNVLIASLLLACLNLPLITNGNIILEESKVSNIIFKVSPSISDQLLEFGENIVEFTQVEDWANKDFNAKDMVYLLNTMNEFDVLTSENLSSFYQDYAWQVSQVPSITIESSEYDELIGMIDALPENEELKNVLKSKLMY